MLLCEQTIPLEEGIEMTHQKENKKVWRPDKQPAI
jgi:hypothetical protein